FYLACCDYEEGKTDAAIAGFSRLEPALQKANPDPGFLPVVVHNLADLYLKAGQLSRAREYVRKFQARYPDDPAGETLHRRLIEEFFAAGQLATGVDELQRFMGAYPDSPYRDELLFAAGKAFFRHRNYQRSLLYFEQVTGEYLCSAVYDSSRAYADFIHTYHSPTRQTGVEELARLIGKIILGEDRRQLMYELGQVYLRDLQAFEEAAAIFRKYLEAARDSTEVGEGAYYLAESYLRLAEYQQFRNPRQAAPYREQAMQALKTAMTHVRHVPHPDTLTYRFLSLQLPPESTPPEKLVQFWQRFEQAYPESPLLPAARWRLAKGYLAAGDTVQALAYLELLIGDAGNPLYRGYAYWEKAQLSAARGNLDIAIQTLKDFLLETPKHPYQARAYRQLAEYHTELGDFATAAQFLERLQQLFNYAEEAGDAPLLIADNYIRAGEFGKAFEVISPFLSREELATDPIARRYLYAPPAAFHFYAGKAHYLRDEFRPARRHLMAYLNQEPQGAFQGESLLLLGKMAQEEGDYDSALLHFSLIPQDAGEEIFYQATAIAADILLDQEKYTEALEKYDILIPLSKDPDQKIANEVQKLRCLIHLGRQSAYQTQLKAFEATYKKHPRKAQYLALLELERGKYAYGQKNFDRAIRHFKRVRSKFKNTDYADDAQYYLGRCYATLNRTEEAMKELTRFLKDFPNSNLLGNGYLTLAEIYFRAEKGVEGLEAVKKAVEVAADPATKRSALALLIRTYRDNGLWDAALQATREYLQQFPHAPDAVSHKISLGIFLTRLNRYTEAIDYLQRLKYEVSSEDEPEIQYYIGEAYYNAGQYEQAINEFLKIPLLSRKTKLQWEASAFYMAGQSYEKLGRISDAVRMYQEIIERPGIRIEFKREARRLIERLKQ
ncbi:MAG: outer membrane protein assembly factor BamD, partial [Calditrichaeota bacterium]